MTASAPHPPSRNATFARMRGLEALVGRHRDASCDFRHAWPRGLQRHGHAGEGEISVPHRVETVVRPPADDPAQVLRTHAQLVLAYVKETASRRQFARRREPRNARRRDRIAPDEEPRVAIRLEASMPFPTAVLGVVAA